MGLVIKLGNVRVKLPDLDAQNVFLYAIIAVVSIVVVFKLFFKDDKKKQQQQQKQTIAQAAPAQPVKEDNRPKLKIFFGSQTGTAEGYSKTLANKAGLFGFNASVVDLADYTPDNLAMEELVIFIVATYGEGEPTDNARDFWDWLHNDHPSDLLSNVKFSVFGLGNKQYKIYQSVGRGIDKRLEELGATRVFAKGEGDADSTLEEDFEDWSSKVLPSLAEQFAASADQQEEKIEKAYEITIHDHADGADHEPFVHNVHETPSNKFPFMGTVTVNTELLRSSERSTRHIEIDISGSKITYEAGDHLGVLAANHPEVVEAYAQRLGISDKLDKLFQLNKVSKDSNVHNSKDSEYLFPKKKVTIRTAMSYYMDLVSIPKKQLFRAFAIYASDPQEQAKLQLLGANTDEGKEAYKNYVKVECFSPLDILNDFPSINIPLDHFMELMPAIKPRYYSIASSSKMHPHSIHIVVAVTNYPISRGRTGKGLCSNFLMATKPGDKVPIFVRQSKFKLPQDHSVPVIMVGPGTGFAPFRGFLQQRQVALRIKQLGDGMMFFGCRRRNEDYIYQDELETAERTGVISKLLVAFSREAQSKVYVQHLLKQNAKQVYEHIVKRGGYFYVCGDARYMANDVDRTLVEIVQEEGGMTEKQASDFVQSILNEGRYLRDVWSPQSQ